MTNISNGKAIKISLESWKKLKHLSADKEKSIIALFDEIMEGKRDPVTGEEIINI